MVLNPVERRLVYISNDWLAFRDAPGPGVLIWEAPGNAQRLVRAFFESQKHETAYSSGDQPAGTSFTLPVGVLQTGKTYHWRMRYKSARGTYSDWSAPTTFTTAAQFSSFIPTPAATPANFGDALGGTEEKAAIRLTEHGDVIVGVSSRHDMEVDLL